MSIYNEFHNLTDPKLFTEDNKQKIWKLISIKEEIPLMFPSLNNMSWYDDFVWVSIIFFLEVILQLFTTRNIKIQRIEFFYIGKSTIQGNPKYILSYWIFF